MLTFGCLKSPPSPISGWPLTVLLPHLVTGGKGAGDSGAWCGVGEVRFARSTPDVPARKRTQGSWSHSHRPLTTSKGPRSHESQTARTQCCCLKQKHFPASSHLPHPHHGFSILPTLHWKLRAPQKAQGLTIECLRRAGRKLKYGGEGQLKGNS